MNWTVLVGLTVALSGCASAPEVFGIEARYSPAYRGYVMAAESGSDDPAAGDTVLLLRDPVTGDKLVCSEQVHQWRELHEDLAADATHDENVALAVGLSTGLTFAPLIALEPAGAVIAAEALLTAEGLYDAFRSDDAHELLTAGIALFERRRYARAAEFFERALAKDPAVGLMDKALYHLGHTYEKLGRPERARETLALYVRRAAVRDVKSYRAAEATLTRLGYEVTPCAGQEPVPLHW